MERSDLTDSYVLDIFIKKITNGGMLYKSNFL